MKSGSLFFGLGFIAFVITSCTTDQETILSTSNEDILFQIFGDQIDLNQLENYSNPFVPNYIVADNSIDNPITDAGATLGRVLFYDKNLSTDNSVSCANCHKQALAFGDDQDLSQGVNGLTARHSIRLVNARFARETQFFWDERANTLEEQTTMPIKDHVEMGWSGTEGNPNLEDLLQKMSTLEYYPLLFEFVYGSTEISEDKIQLALAQFVRSIYSFDSPYDQGLTMANGNINANFPNFTPSENTGKMLFTAPPQFDTQGSRIGGGLGCQGCHRAPEFDIGPNSLSNGVTLSFDGQSLDLGVHRSPSLRDLFNEQGILNGPLMHNARFQTLEAALNHYNEIPENLPSFAQLDPRLSPGGNPQKLNMTPEEILAVTDFLKTLSGSEIYSHSRWSDPF